MGTVTETTSRVCSEFGLLMSKFIYPTFLLTFYGSCQRSSYTKSFIFSSDRVFIAGQCHQSFCSSQCVSQSVLKWMDKIEVVEDSMSSDLEMEGDFGSVWNIARMRTRIQSQRRDKIFIVNATSAIHPVALLTGCWCSCRSHKTLRSVPSFHACQSSCAAFHAD